MYKTKFQIKLNDATSQSLQSLFAIFALANKELYLVGGCVRDFILDREPKDIDLCTSATPDEVKTLMKKYDDNYKIFDSGIKHGTLTLFERKFRNSFEITTFRTDGKYTDNRHPDDVKFTASLEEDLKRRDFTINSFAYDIEKETIYMLDESYLKDLELGIIRCVGNADERFQEDALRMLRAIRLSAQLGYSIEENTLHAIKRNSALITNISAERIRDELTKILCSDNPHMLEILITTGLHKHIIPELEEMLNCKQINKYHYTDVLHHTFDVIKNLPKNNMRLRWSALFHDMGKPESVSVDEEGYEHFYGHALLSADKVKKYSEILKFDNNTAEFVYKIVKYHDREFADMRINTFKKLINTVGIDIFNDYIKFRQADALAHRFSDELLEGISLLKERYMNIILHSEPMSLKDLAINGHDISALGFKGKDVGNVLSRCLDYVLSSPDNNTRESLLNLIKEEYLNEKIN